MRPFVGPDQQLPRRLRRRHAERALALVVVRAQAHCTARHSRRAGSPPKMTRRSLQGQAAAGVVGPGQTLDNPTSSQARARQARRSLRLGALVGALPRYKAAAVSVLVLNPAT